VESITCTAGQSFGEAPVRRLRQPWEPLSKGRADHCWRDADIDITRARAGLEGRNLARKVRIGCDCAARVSKRLGHFGKVCGRTIDHFYTLNTLGHNEWPVIIVESRSAKRRCARDLASHI
jgi:hypothetical protein